MFISDVYENAKHQELQVSSKGFLGSSGSLAKEKWATCLTERVLFYEK